MAEKNEYFTQKLENSVSMETLTKAQQQALTERMQAWLDFGSSYDIFKYHTFARINIKFFSSK